MKWSVVLLFVGAAVAVADEVVLAKDCDVELCKLPDCRCSSTNIPGDLLPRDTPQVSCPQSKLVEAVTSNEYVKVLLFDDRFYNFL